MRTLLIGLTFLGLTTLATAQEDFYVFNHVQLKEIETSPALNQAYFSAVNDKHSSHQVQLLEAHVNHFDFTNSDIFENSFDNYTMLFETINGTIMASYDKNGQLLNCVEKFENVLLPEKVMHAIMTVYPSWTLNETAYRVVYHRGRDPKKIYQIRIMKDTHQIDLKIDCKGAILHSKNHKVMKT